VHVLKHFGANVASICRRHKSGISIQQRNSREDYNNNVCLWASGCVFCLGMEKERDYRPLLPSNGPFRIDVSRDSKNGT